MSATAILAIVFDLLKALPAVLRLLQSIADYAAIRRGEASGRAEAVAEALAIAAEQVRLAAQARAEAASAHAKWPKSDDAFDRDFEGKD